MCSYNTMKPVGSVAVGRCMSRCAPETKLLEAIFSHKNVSEAWRRVKANRGQPGCDGISIDQFPEQFRSQWPEIRASLLNGEYQPQAVKRVEIPKDTGGTRPLGIPNVLDRLVQQAITRVLSPCFDPLFSQYSYGFRPKCSAQQAVFQLRAYIAQGYSIAVDVDLKQFFDRVNHDVLMHLVSKQVKDKRVLALIGKYLRSGVMVQGRLAKSRQGVPQGGPLSPLLANIVLNELDQELERRGHKFVRYADDFVILVKSQRAGERVMTSVSRFLEKRLKLQVNEDKSQVVSTNQLEYLGFGFVETKLKWSPAAFAKFKRQLKRLTSRTWGVSMEYRLGKLRQYMRGWVNYFGIAEFYREIPHLDEWLRRRVRLCYWFQWKWARTRITNLLKLGVKLMNAVYLIRTQRGPWFMTRSKTVHWAMTNGWLRKQGVLSVKELWSRIHYPATAR